MFFIDTIKQRLHRDLASHPTTHAWVLNLYLNGERYPQTVSDYFPSQFAPSESLANELTRHRGDEHKHELLLAKAIRSLNHEVVEIPRVNVFNEVIRDCTPSRFATFHIEETDSHDTKREKLAHFLAHAHFLEKRVARSLMYHVDACESVGSTTVARQVHAVLRDEERHVSYTLEHVRDLLPDRLSEKVINLHRKAEAKANLVFSSQQLRNYAKAFRNTTVPAHRRMLYRFCSVMMDEASQLV